MKEVKYDTQKPASFAPNKNNNKKKKSHAIQTPVLITSVTFLFKPIFSVAEKK